MSNHQLERADKPSRPTSKSVRAVLLALVMICSMVAMTASFAAPVGASHNRSVGEGEGALSPDQFNDSDANMSSNVRFWSGEELYFQNNVSEESETWELVTVKRDDNHNWVEDEFILELGLGANGARTLDTATLDTQRHAILDKHGEYVEFDGDNFGNVSDTHPDDANDAFFRIVAQDFDADWDADSVSTAADDVVIEIESNRGDYDVEMYADNFNADDLETLFEETPHSIDRSDDTVENDEGIIIEGVSDDDEITANVSNLAEERDIDRGGYEFDLEVKDTGVAATTNIIIFPEGEENSLTYTFSVPNDGGTHTVGVPGEVNGTLADMLDPAAEGYTTFMFQDGDWEQVSDFESTTLEPLDAIAIATEDEPGQQTEFTVTIEFEEQSPETAPPQRGLDEGWNFVAAPAFDDVDTVFGVSGAFLVLDRFDGAESPEVQSTAGFDNHYVGSNSNDATPFKGYFLFVEDDTTLPGVLSGVQTRENVTDQLDIDPFA